MGRLTASQLGLQHSKLCGRDCGWGLGLGFRCECGVHFNEETMSNICEACAGAGVIGGLTCEDCDGFGEPSHDTCCCDEYRETLGSIAAIANEAGWTEIYNMAMTALLAGMPGRD